jgi:PIN domain nuclease of toxin-antitoxin system
LGKAKAASYLILTSSEKYERWPLSQLLFHTQAVYWAISDSQQHSPSAWQRIRHFSNTLIINEEMVFELAVKRAIGNFSS